MILCCGEALIDMIVEINEAGEPVFKPHAGGAIFNSAVAIGRLGAPSGLLTGLSSDFFGDVLRGTMAASNVSDKYAIPSDRPTTLAFVRLVNGQASYAFYDENTATRLLHIDDIPALDDAVSALLFGGISLISEPCGSTFEALMMREKTKRVIMLDPNIRANFVQDRDAYLSRLNRMIKHADIIKLSDEDLGWFASEDNQDAKIDEWLAQGVRLIIITRGANGADAYTPHGKLCVAAQKVNVVDTVGAGDTVNAGILASLHSQQLLNKQAVAKLSDMAILQALRLGINAASVTISRAGANPPWAHEL
ncbi:carbohydrate kinase family protein [Paenochrobactrum pullorum]|uniref:carbohydrate kinase family protein n=1 Tax=Paenochrobactrum pullorum TaxID=1324351 RepID=UPI0035BBA9DD